MKLLGAFLAGATVAIIVLAWVYGGLEEEGD